MANSETTILVVDDDEMMLTMAEMILKKEQGYNVVKAISGIQALQKLQTEEKIDLILLDIQMPGMDGLKTMELIKKHDYWKTIPVVFLTASSDKNTVVKAGLLGPAGYIKKPFVPQDFLQRIQTVLAEAALDKLMK